MTAIPCSAEDLFCDLAEEGAAAGLLALMTGISEENWCAGWMSDLEYALWEVAPGTPYGQGVITERQSTLLRLLSEESDSWWYYEDKVGPRIIRRAKWAARMEELRSKRALA